MRLIYTNYKYDYVIRKVKQHHYFGLLLIQEQFEEAKKEEFRDIYVKLNKVEKTKIFVKQYFPGIAKILINLKRRLL